MTPLKRSRRPSTVSGDPRWYKDAIVYEVYLRSFQDSNGDGIGDFRGLTERLGYLEDLGVTALWLLPFYPSPLRDGGYDISDYVGVHPDYGTLDDFRRFLDEAHRRGLRVITELVINHTSSEHAWFQRARRAPPGSIERDFYVWHDSPDRYAEARIIFKDFEATNWAWDPVARAYYWHRFYAHQPDLNFDNPAVREALFGVLDHWLAMGVDGLRLDAIPYLYEREGTNCENLPETHAFLKSLRAHVDEHFPERMLLAEANQWPVDAAAYFGDGDECHMNFHFPLMPRLYMALELEDSFPIIDILDQTPPIPESCQWATFLRNHDELTLEMVTEEDRDYMYRAYAADHRARINLGIRRRLAPLMRDRRRIELLVALLFAMPGTPVLYYGDEIGMGDNIYLGDRDGVRTPMQWSSDRNAGFSRANPQRLYLPVIVDPEYHYEAVNVEAQQANPSSLLWWTKQQIALRRSSRVLSRGSMDFVASDNHKLLAFVREHEGERVLFVANLSRHPQHGRLELGRYRDCEPVEAQGRSRFPRIDAAAWPVSLGPYGYYWFVLHSPRESMAELAPIVVHGRWERVIDAPHADTLATRVGSFMESRRWFRGKGRARRGETLRDAFVIERGDQRFVLLLLGVDYVSEASETYVVPLGFVSDHELEASNVPAHAVVSPLVVERGGTTTSGRLYDALASPSLASALLELSLRGGTLLGQVGELVLERSEGAPTAIDPDQHAPKPAEIDQTNSVFLYGSKLVLKLLRSIEQGPNPEDELLRFFEQRGVDRLVPRTFGRAHYRAEDGSTALVSLLTEYVPHRSTAFALTVDAVEHGYERLLVEQSDREAAPPRASLLPTASAEVPLSVPRLTEPYLLLTEQLARRVAELHLLLATDDTDPRFRPEPFDTMYQQSLYQRARTNLARCFDALARRRAELPSALADTVASLLERERLIDARLRRVTEHRIQVSRIRTHGDLHLGQVLFTGDDFVILDFEGEPARSLGERRIKRCTLRDVAGMVRSFDYAVSSSLREGRIRPADLEVVRPWARTWESWVSASFVEAYLGYVAGSPIVPPTRQDARRLLDFYLLEKCIYEVDYELENRPAWVDIPLESLRQLLDEEPRD